MCIFIVFLYLIIFMLAPSIEVQRQISSEPLGQFGIVLPELMIAAEGQAFGNLSTHFSWTQVLQHFFIGITALLLLSFATAILKLLFIIKHGTLTHEGDKKIILSSEIKNPCSFFNYIHRCCH